MSGGGDLNLLNCSITSNESAEAGGGVYSAGLGTLNMKDCQVVSNEAFGSGGGVHSESFFARLKSCLVAVNHCGTDGGGIRMAGVDLSLESCTIANNGAQWTGGGLNSFESNTTLIGKTILWGNCATAAGEDFFSWGSVTMSCSAIDTTDIDGTGIITYEGDQVTSDPMFCDEASCPDGITVNPEDDYSLRHESPCLPESSPCGELIGAFGEGCLGSGITDLPPASVSRRFLLAPNPNPSMGRVSCGIHLRSSGRVRIQVFDVAGRLVSSLIDADMPPGLHHLEWNPARQKERRHLSGIYYIRAQVEGSVETAKLVLAK
jgi:hypothetical protein